jgi:hypothetical protein
MVDYPGILQMIVLVVGEPGKSASRLRALTNQVFSPGKSWRDINES